MKVTRILHAEFNTELLPIIKQTAFLRADIWRRYGALKNIGQSAGSIRKDITAGKLYTNLTIDGTIRAETTKDVVNDILAYREAAKLKVKKAIFKRTSNREEQKRLFGLLKKEEWMSDNFLHRQMRKHFKHGVANADNQFVVRSDKFSTEVIGGFLHININIAYKNNLVLKTTTSGKDVDIQRSNLRIIVHNGFVEVHYSMDKEEGRTCGDRHIGIDKGYTEAYTDSDGEFHGKGFGKVITEYSDKQSQTGKARSRLHSLEKKYREQGKQQKADNIKKNNLGRRKLEARNKLTKKRLRNIAFKAAHSIVDKAKVVAAEDLTSPMSSKKPWKKFNRRMSSWAKGVLAEALDSTCQQRDSLLELQNCAYTSQMDSTNGLLEGKRKGDRFYRENGDVMQADFNAARNVLARLYDTDINRFTPYKEVKQILLARSSGGTDRQLAQVAGGNIY